MKNPKLTQSLANLDKAMLRLQEALQESEANSLIVDATIQRFEFVIELFWKTLKRALAANGIESNTPKETLRKAYAAKWIDDETKWLQMLNDRNATSHTYDEKKAQEIYQHIKSNFPTMQKTLDFLKNYAQ